MCKIVDSGVAVGGTGETHDGGTVEIEAYIDRIACSESGVGLRALPDDSIPLTVTSPPYDGLRAFGGHEFGHETFERVAREL